LSRQTHWAVVFTSCLVVQQKIAACCPKTGAAGRRSLTRTVCADNAMARPCRSRNWRRRRTRGRGLTIPNTRQSRPAAGRIITRATSSTRAPMPGSDTLRGRSRVGVRLPPSTVMRNISFRRPRYRSGPRQKCARTRHCLPSSMPTSAGELEDDHSQPQCESPGARKPHQLRCAVLHPCRMLRRNIDSQREDS